MAASPYHQMQVQHIRHLQQYSSPVIVVHQWPPQLPRALVHPTQGSVQHLQVLVHQQHPASEHQHQTSMLHLRYLDQAR